MNPPIRLIVGLGNPEPDYEETRHNTGFWLVDKLAQQYQQHFQSDSRHHGSVCKLNIQGEEVRLLKPATYMNRSGQSVSSLANYFRISPNQIMVAHDELDLDPGQIRLKIGGGHAGHNGLRNIMSALGSRDFPRLRIGIDHPNDRSEVVNYVLGRPSKIDREAINTAIDNTIDCLDEVVKGELQKAMNRLHSSR
ncbi:MAG: aminoacyl-tRNA hydrolase [Candidatus Thiodiazotropha sp. (ex Lucinoma aequizonata)]|nr:aminoacyl-tRNA hydrolase [Candidatus Thiodiazotropha sp. (ex Lucinoma aequizonata)]MCU7889287.1 aminoacyl-tRNA hydrolase [Candidatus Thiodiazotropha sp. (ex Lucinoma aequizonata)]MCU7895577.1 aminoacyl-tRNA hydrolase [Candidatus Thiodiazotropha sp. (ex Lucinoma aequizonata)]MCU7900137.1 aminoacyl-tRNA hydrolase [Candidatus Thiodiazotropha sp. (ex Lucinoma aequizonata)]MCU7902852.1 aminoacyl-tRNA hydrolase [Candidatus Thiodiazotropha sp. (ex Lucinoma aequizonata)]